MMGGAGSKGDLLKVHVTHCRGWSFGRQFKTLKKDLEQCFPHQLEITSEKTATKTGDFEVQVVGGNLLHSKKNGDGQVTPAKFNLIVAGIKKVLGEPQENNASDDDVEADAKAKTPPKKAAKNGTKAKGKPVKKAETATNGRPTRAKKRPTVTIADPSGSSSAKRTRRR